MATLLVAYDLDKPGQDYGVITDKLRSFGAWWHHLDSTWLVCVEMTPAQLRDQLRPLIDANDKLLVIDITHRSAAWAGLSDRAAQWIKANI